MQYNLCFCSKGFQVDYSYVYGPHKRHPIPHPHLWIMGCILHFKYGWPCDYIAGWHYENTSKDKVGTVWMITWRNSYFIVCPVILCGFYNPIIELMQPASNVADDIIMIPWAVKVSCDLFDNIWLAISEIPYHNGTLVSYLSALWVLMIKSEFVLVFRKYVLFLKPLLIRKIKYNYIFLWGVIIHTCVPSEWYR